VAEVWGGDAEYCAGGALNIESRYSDGSRVRFRGRDRGGRSNRRPYGDNSASANRRRNKFAGQNELGALVGIAVAAAEGADRAWVVEFGVRAFGVYRREAAGGKSVLQICVGVIPGH
jgi:hypothetical protein